MIAPALPASPRNQQRTEVAAILPLKDPITRFRDASGNLLKQAQRFRVFAYDGTNPNDPGTEVKTGENGVAAIEWTAYLANKKAVWYKFEQLTGSGQEGDPGYLNNGSKNTLRNALIWMVCGSLT